MPVGSGALSTRFRGGAQSGSHRPVSTPCPPNRDVRISRIRLSSGIMHLARGAPVRSLTRGTGGFACPGSQKLHGFTREVPLSDAPPDLFTP